MSDSIFRQTFKVSSSCDLVGNDLETLCGEKLFSGLM